MPLPPRVKPPRQASSGQLMKLGWIVVAALLSTAIACSDDADEDRGADAGPHAVADSSVPEKWTAGEAIPVVPSAGLPPEVTALNANNNLDVVRHDGRVFLAYRTAKWHFADDNVYLFVVSSADQETWRFEGKFFMGTDLREPRFLAWDGKLWLYFAVLGKDLGAFEPGDARGARYESPGKWTKHASLGLGDFIPWRARVVAGKPLMIGYNNGGDVYSGGKIPDIHVKILTTTDGMKWTPAVGKDGIVLKGGVSETDFAVLADGSLVAVGRNEAGDKDGFGSKVCTAPKDDWATWTCTADPRKPDSPLVFMHKGKPWLIGRRTTANDGNFDLKQAGKSHSDRYTAYQLAWWTKPKRCSLWSIDPKTRTFKWVLDIASKGDTCFASAVADKIGPSRHESFDGPLWVYNYTSPVDGKDVPWQTGQFGHTLIYRIKLQR